MKEIPLPSGDVALVDDADYERVIAGGPWYVKRRSTKYAAHWVYLGKRPDGRDRGREIYMHRFILNAQPGTVVDHRDGNGLNNQRTNIRAASAKINQQNKQHRGACYDKQNRAWRSSIRVGGKRLFLGSFRTAEEARAAYLVAVKEHRGDDAPRAFEIAQRAGAATRVPERAGDDLLDDWRMGSGLRP